MTADTDAIENVTLMYCPPERVVRVDVPLKVSLLSLEGAACSWVCRGRHVARMGGRSGGTEAGS